MSQDKTGKCVDYSPAAHMDYTEQYTTSVQTACDHHALHEHTVCLLPEICSPEQVATLLSQLAYSNNMYSARAWLSNIQATAWPIDMLMM